MNMLKNSMQLSATTTGKKKAMLTMIKNLGQSVGEPLAVLPLNFITVLAG
jgi:hypothetical protein